MGTNEGWPEAFGFSVVGDAPVMINEVEEGGSAQQAGLQMGDFLVELDGEVVEQWSRDEVIELAQQSCKVPPSLVVVSRMREFSLPKREDGGFGVTFRGNSPVFIRSVDFDSHARSAGLRSGDLVVELNGRNVRYSMKVEVLELLKSTKSMLQLKVVAGGLAPVYNSSMVETPRRKGRGQQKMNQEKRMSQEMIVMRYEKARLFHSKMDYYLMGDPLKKMHLLTLLRLYSKDRDINSLGASLNILLDSPTEKRLCQDIRVFIHPSHHDRFDSLASFNPNCPLSANRRRNRHWQGSLMWSRPLGTAERKTHIRSSLPDLSVPLGRTVQVMKGSGNFGLTLSGNAPVFIRSVDKGGASDKAGLRSGDQLLQLNGINIRGATHSQVVQLLRSSGPYPTFVVFSPSASHVPSGYGTLTSHDVATLTTETKRSVGAFKEKMRDVLSDEEKQIVMKQLSKFSKHKEIPELVNSLSWVLDSPTKTVLFHYICQLLPDEAQQEFDRIAAAMLAREPTSTTGHLEGEIILNRDMRLSSSSSSSDPSIQLPWTESRGGAREVCLGGASRGGGGGEYRGPGNYGRGSGRGAIGGQVGGEWGGGGSGGEGGGDGGNVTQGLDRIANNSPRRQNSRERAEEAISHLPTPTQTPLSGLKSITNASIVSTPGVPLPPNPPPTPAGGVGAIPIPPPPPPTVPGDTHSHLKRVNWEKIHGTEGTIWRELSGLEEALEYFEIEEQFASQKNVVATKKASKPAVLDEKKAYNISILLGHLKLPIDQIKEAILACDETVLSEQHLRQMEAFAPDQKECLGFARFYDDPSVLSKADRFSCEMSSISGYQQRLRAMTFKLHFKEKIDEIKPDLEAISIASKELQASKNFKRVLEIVLAVGNYMNAGNRRVGGAIGFKINFLTQLKDLKTTDKKSTLLHFVAATVERKFPQVMEFSEDLSHTSAAARISGETLEVEVNEMMKGLQEIQKTIEEFSIQEDSSADKFCEVMTTFVSWADKEITGMLRAYAHMKQEYASVLRFYGEDPSTTRIDDFFSTFAAFISDFERAVKENHENRERQAMIEMKAKEKEQITKKKGGFRLFSRSSKNVEDEMKKELEAKSKSKKIDIKALEESQQAKVMVRTSKPQLDFRHLLRKTEHSKPIRLSGEKRRSGNKPLMPEDSSTPKLLKIESRKISRSIPSEITELTGSWDYIPSAPTSTVELTANEDNEEEESRNTNVASIQVHKAEVEPSYDHQRHHVQYREWDSRQLPYDNAVDDEDDDDDMMSSPPVLNLDVSGGGGPNSTGWNKINQDFDFETQF